MKRTTIFAAVATMSVALLVTGCSGSSSTSSESPFTSPAASTAESSATPVADALDVCTVLNAEEIKSITGKDPGTATTHTSSCVYENMMVLSVLQASVYSKYVEKIAALYGPDQKSDVSGIGNEAVMFTSDNGNANVIANDGEYTVGASAETQDQAQAIALAMLATLESGVLGTEQ